MHIELRIQSPLDIRLRARDAEPEDVGTILADVSKRAEGQAEVLVSGFGQERGP